MLFKNFKIVRKKGWLKFEQKSILVLFLKLMEKEANIEL